jgi:histone H3/H4
MKNEKLNQKKIVSCFLLIKYPGWAGNTRELKTSRSSGHFDFYQNKMALVIKNNIRKYVELAVSDEVERELERKTEEMLKKAEERAKANGRRTIYARDL